MSDSAAPVKDSQWMILQPRKERIPQCSVCEDSFQNMDYLRKHFKDCHPHVTKDNVKKSREELQALEDEEVGDGKSDVINDSQLLHDFKMPKERRKEAKHCSKDSSNHKTMPGYSVIFHNNFLYTFVI